MPVSHAEFDDYTSAAIKMWLRDASHLSGIERQIFLCDGFPFWFNQFVFALACQKTLLGKERLRDLGYIK